MYKHPVFILFVLIFVSSCGSESGNNNSSDNQNESDTTPRIEELYGTWRYIDDNSRSFLYIEETYEEYYDHKASHDCYIANRNEFSNVDNFRLSYQSHVEGTASLGWHILEDKLVLTNSDGTSSTLTRTTDNPRLVAICPDSIELSVVNISIGFQELPESIPAGRYLNLYLQFDLNGNGIHDNSDISFVFLKFSSDDTTPISSLNAYSRKFITQESEHRSTSYYLAKTDYSIDNNDIVFQIKKSDHEAFLDITAEASIHVKVYTNDQNDVTQADYFPDYDTYTPAGTDLSNMFDNSDDVYSPTSEPIHFDIEEISIEFID